jgi:hypothetical protein
MMVKFLDEKVTAYVIKNSVTKFKPNVIYFEQLHTDKYCSCAPSLGFLSLCLQSNCFYDGGQRALYSLYFYYLQTLQERRLKCFKTGMLKLYYKF